MIVLKRVRTRSRKAEDIEPDEGEGGEILARRVSDGDVLEHEVTVSSTENDPKAVPQGAILFDAVAIAEDTNTESTQGAQAKVSADVPI